MAERALIEQLVAGGMTPEAANAAADAVLAAVRPVLLLGKSVMVPGVGRLIAPLKPARVPGPGPQRAAMQKKATLRNAAVIERGEPYAL